MEECLFGGLARHIHSLPIQILLSALYAVSLALSVYYIHDKDVYGFEFSPLPYKSSERYLDKMEEYFEVGLRPTTYAENIEMKIASEYTQLSMLEFSDRL